MKQRRKISLVTQKTSAIQSLSSVLIRKGLYSEGDSARSGIYKRQTIGPINGNVLYTDLLSVQYSSQDVIDYRFQKDVP